MSWKSTINITRSEAKKLIIERLINIDQLSNIELADIIESLGYGDNNELHYYGHNFLIIDD